MATQYSFDDPVYAMIVKANIHLLLNQPFFGQLVSRLDLELCDDKTGQWCKTAATDGNKLYFNRDFVKSLTPKELLFVLGHEILHCLYDHLGRRRGREPDLWNMANDYIVNYTLKQHRLGEMPSHGLYDERFTDDMTSEEVYAILKKNSVEIKMTLDQHLEAASGDEENDDDDDGDGDQQGEGSGDQDGDGDGDDEGQGNGGGSGQETKITVTGKDGPPKLTKAELDSVRNKLKAAAIQAMQQGAGSVPEAVRKRLGDLIEPKMDWRALLDSHLRSALKDDFTFRRLSRRDFGSGLILPSQDVLEVVEVDVSLDVSGSMSDEMVRDIMSEVKGIMQTFPDFKLRVWQFDTKVVGFREFTPHNIDDINDYERLAGGGTMFECNWEFMKKNDIEPHRFVMFTDGYPCGSWGDAEYCDTLFVIHGNTKIKAPFGQTAYYEAPEKLAEAA